MLRSLRCGNLAKRRDFRIEYSRKSIERDPYPLIEGRASKGDKKRGINGWDLYLEIWVVSKEIVGFVEISRIILVESIHKRIETDTEIFFPDGDGIEIKRWWREWEFDWEDSGGEI